MFNRPFDEQSHLRIRLETEAKLAIQEEIRRGTFQLIWSYVLDYENSKNPFQERKEQIVKWKKYAIADIEENTEIINTAILLNTNGLKKWIHYISHVLDLPMRTIFSPPMTG
jgi:hypothetical protein